MGVNGGWDAVICNVCKNFYRKKSGGVCGKKTASIMSINNSDEHDAQHGVRSRQRTASPAASVRAKGCVFISPINHEEQRGNASRNGAGADLLVVRPRGFANMTGRLSSPANRTR